jgi:transposase
MQIRSVGIDLGKTTFHLVALGASGKVLVKKKFSQKQLLAFTANMQTSLIGLEACSGAHFLGRALRQQGHDVRLIAAQFVKPFVKSNKNDFVDAEAIAEAVERKNMRFVPIKTDDQLDLQAMHRIRDRLVARRTAVINQIRAFLLERGMVFAQKPAKLKAAMADVLENADNALTPMMRNMIGILWDEWKTVEQQIDELTDRLEQIATNDAGCRHRQRCGVPQGTRLRSVARLGATTVFDRRQGQAAGHQQARQHLLTQGSDPRRSRCCDAYKTRPVSDQSMDERARSKSATQPAGRRDGEQACPYRLGCALQRRRLSTQSYRSGSSIGTLCANPAPSSSADQPSP